MFPFKAIPVWCFSICKSNTKEKSEKKKIFFFFIHNTSRPMLFDDRIILRNIAAYTPYGSNYQSHKKNLKKKIKFNAIGFDYSICAGFLRELKTTIGLCWRAILFSNPLSAARQEKSFRKRRSLERSSAGPTELSYVSTRRKIMSTQSRFYFTEPPVSDIIAGSGVSLSISILRQYDVACVGYRGSLGESLSSRLIDELDFIGQLIIDRSLMRRRDGDCEASRGSIYVSPSTTATGYAATNIESHRGPYQADYRLGCARPPDGLIIDRSLYPRMYLTITSAPKWDRGDGNVALLMLSRR